MGDYTCRIYRIRSIDMAKVREEMAALDSDAGDEEGHEEIQVSSGGT